MNPPIIAFIGWHNSGKTTLVSRVVAELRARGLRVGVIKSTKEQGLAFGATDCDTTRHRQAGADPVLLAAPDQLILQMSNQGQTLSELADRHMQDVDLVVAEGFKDAAAVPKIEVFHTAGRQPLRHQVANVIAVASTEAVTDLPWFDLNNPLDLVPFILRTLDIPPPSLAP